MGSLEATVQLVNLLRMVGSCTTAGVHFTIMGAAHKRGHTREHRTVGIGETLLRAVICVVHASPCLHHRWGPGRQQNSRSVPNNNQTWIQYRVGIVLKDYYKKDGGGGKSSKRQRQQGQDRRPGKENHFDMRKLSKGDNKENHNQFKYNNIFLTFMASPPTKNPRHRRGRNERVKSRTMSAGSTCAPMWRSGDDATAVREWQRQQGSAAMMRGGTRIR